MPVGIIGKKLGMTQVFDRNGHLLPVTVVEAGPCPVIQIKTKEKDGYSAIQIGFDKISNRRKNRKPVAGHFKASGKEPTRVLRELRVDDVSEYSLGSEISVDAFSVDDTVTITGISKGRGFTGVMKRHGFAGKDRGHGAHEAYRHGGSIGCRTPKRTIKGMKMPGRMGTKRVTIKNIQVVFVDRENNLLLLKGAVPGWNGGYVWVKKSS